MQTPDLHFGSDANAVLQYLNNFPGQFISEMEISRRAEGRNRFADDARWSHGALQQLLELNMIETDGNGRYRLKTPALATHTGPKKFIDPKLRSILEQSGHNFDLSNFT
jgi:hypothetical protein